MWRFFSLHISKQHMNEHHSMQRAKTPNNNWLVISDLSTVQPRVSIQLHGGEGEYQLERIMQLPGTRRHYVALVAAIIAMVAARRMLYLRLTWWLFSERRLRWCHSIHYLQSYYSGMSEGTCWTLLEHALSRVITWNNCCRTRVVVILARCSVYKMKLSPDWEYHLTNRVRNSMTAKQ